MKFYITHLNGYPANASIRFSQLVTAEIAHQLGAQEMAVYCFNQTSETADRRSVRFDGMIAGLSDGDFVVLQLPTYNGFSYESDLIQKIHDYGGCVVLLLQEIPALGTEHFQKEILPWISLYNQADALILPSFACKELLVRNGLRINQNCILRELSDFPHSVFPLPPSQSPYTSTRTGAAFHILWPEQPEKLQALRYQALEAGPLLAAGIPLIVPKGIACQRLMEQNHLGLAVNTLDEARILAENMSSADYHILLQHTKKFASLLTNGYLTKQALIESACAITRSDYAVSRLPDTLYETGVCQFSYTTVQEAYPDQYAISWNYQGSCSGFVICDADTQEILFETADSLSHYCTVPKTRENQSFLIRSYERTDKGHLVLATTERLTAALPKSLSENPQISVIIPTYNASAHIAHAINTSIAQSFSDLEILVIDDGSTDDTLSVLQWYADHFPCVRFLQQTNQKLAAARNHGVQNARGTYIAFLDSDDMLRPDMLEKLYRSIVKNDCDIATCSAYEISADSFGRKKYKTRMSYPIPEDTALTRQEFLDNYYVHNFPVIWNKLYRKSLILPLPFTNLLHEDEGWTPVVLSYADHICHVNEPLYDYDLTRNPDSISKHYSPIPEDLYQARAAYIHVFLTLGNPIERPWLQKFACMKTRQFLRVFQNPAYHQLMDEIEHFYDHELTTTHGV